MEVTGQDLGAISFSPGGEEWIEFGPDDDRRRIAFHDYDAIYGVPGLYERVFYETLGMRSTAEVVGLYGQALRAEGLDAGAQRVVDFGAGNGLGGDELRSLGVGELYGIDVVPMARTAAERDRPGVYDEYLVEDLGRCSDDRLRPIAEREPTAVLALSAVGVGHVAPEVLERALGLLRPGGIYGFAVAPRLLPGSEDAEGRATGYPEYLRELEERTDRLAERSYVHRHRPDGSEDLAVAFVGRVR